MTSRHAFPALSEPGLARLAERLALGMKPGDIVALEGDLGAGKTTFARALIQALSDGTIEEIPSPTFTLMQTYQFARMSVAHLDLYRLNDASELDELGLDQALDSGIALIEWPERAGRRLSRSIITLALVDGPSSQTRAVNITAEGEASARINRVMALGTFLENAGWPLQKTRLSYLQGDASARAYARAARDDGPIAIVMDSPARPDGPPIRDGKPYSRIAHLAEDVRPFVAIGNALDAAGLSTPEIYASDLDQGFLLIEDLGGKVFSGEISRGADQLNLWRRATDVLTALNASPPPATLPIADFGHDAMAIEASLLPEWYWPLVKGETIPANTKAEFENAWNPVFQKLSKLPKGWVLRDYHSPNLIALDDRLSPRDVGVIDFQDATRGPWAYDLVSLLQDARVDVSAELETILYARYTEAVSKRDPTFNGDQFGFAYAALGAQRNTKILGIFARLAKRDLKPHYLQHIPRIWTYLERDLAHPALSDIKSWYDQNLAPLHAPDIAKLKTSAI